MKELPEYPRAYNNSTHVIIEHSDGSEQIWGEVDNASEAQAIAEQMTISLRAIKYVEGNLEKSIESIREYLIEQSIPDNVIDDAISEGVYGASFTILKKHLNNESDFSNLSREDLLNYSVMLTEREKFFRTRRQSIEEILRQKLMSVRASSSEDFQGTKSG